MELETALARASEESGLSSGERDMVRPLLRMAPRRWPSCCGGGCAPCAKTLAKVALRTLELLERK